MSLYEYVLGNPLRALDPRGLKTRYIVDKSKAHDKVWVKEGTHRRVERKEGGKKGTEQIEEWQRLERFADKVNGVIDKAVDRIAGWSEEEFEYRMGRIKRTKSGAKEVVDFGKIVSKETLIATIQDLRMDVTVGSSTVKGVRGQIRGGLFSGDDVQYETHSAGGRLFVAGERMSAEEFGKMIGPIGPPSAPAGNLIMGSCLWSARSLGKIAEHTHITVAGSSDFKHNLSRFEQAFVDNPRGAGHPPVFIIDASSPFQRAEMATRPYDSLFKERNYGYSEGGPP